MGTLRIRTAGSRLAIVLTTVIVTTVVLVGGVALATVGLNSVGSDEIINNSVRSQDIKDGAVQGKDIRDSDITTKDIRNGTIKPGDLSAIARPRWARVRANQHTAELLSGRGVTDVSRIGVGVFEVTFDSPVTNCGWLATLYWGGNPFPPHGEISIGQEDPKTLTVLTWDSAGNLTDLDDLLDGFTVQVVC